MIMIHVIIINNNVKIVFKLPYDFIMFIQIIHSFNHLFTTYMYIHVATCRCCKSMFIFNLNIQHRLQQLFCQPLIVLIKHVKVL